jgi:hypothetical protein
MMEFDPSYDSKEAYAVMPSSFHDIRDVEFQEGGGQQRQAMAVAWQQWRRSEGQGQPMHG